MDYCKYCAEYFPTSTIICTNCGRKQNNDFTKVNKRDLYNKAVELNGTLPKYINERRISISILLEMVELLQNVIDGGSYTEDGLVLLANSFLLIEQIERTNKNKSTALTYAACIMYYCLFATQKAIRKNNSDIVFTEILKLLLLDGIARDINNFQNTFIGEYSIYHEKAMSPTLFTEISNEILGITELDQQRRSNVFIITGEEVNIIYLAHENHFLVEMGILGGQFPQGSEFTELLRLYNNLNMSTNQWPGNIKKLVLNIEKDKNYELPLANEEVKEIIRFLQVFTNINKNVANNNYNNYFQLASTFDRSQIVVKDNLQKEIALLIEKLQNQQKGK